MSIKVYYLDDEPDFCENFSDFFASKDVLVRTFTKPGEAIEAAKKDPPDIFFTDYRLPGTTGVEVAKSMAAEIPKYLISGDLTVDMDYKFIEVFGKPYNPDDIQRVLNEHLKSV